MAAPKQSYIIPGLADRIIDACSEGVEMTLRAIEKSAKAKAPVRQLTRQHGAPKTETRSFRAQSATGRWSTRQVRVPVKQREMLRIDVAGEARSAQAAFTAQRTKLESSRPRPVRGERLTAAPEKSLTEYLSKQSTPQAGPTSSGIVFGTKGRKPRAKK